MPHDSVNGLAEKRKMPSYNDTITKLAEVVDSRWPSRNAFAAAVGLTGNKSKFYNALKGKGVPGADAFVEWLDAAGARIVWADEREVCTRPVALGVVDGDNAPALSPDHIAIPMGELPVAAGVGVIPTEGTQRWFIAQRKSLGVRRNLVAAEVGKGMDSMAPTVNPGDIVVVDRDDYHTGFNPPGNIFLVRFPDGGLAVKRVAARQNENNVELVFYSDNSIMYHPEKFDLDTDYNGDIRSAIVGRISHIWSELSVK